MKTCLLVVILQDAQTFYQSAHPCVGLSGLPDLAQGATVDNLLKVRTGIVDRQTDRQTNKTVFKRDDNIIKPLQLVNPAYMYLS